MEKIVLISCVSKKINKKSKVEDLYLSPLFRKNLQYAKSINPDKIFILSAKHGLLTLEEEIEPYEKTLNKMKSDEIKIWANGVLINLKKVSDLENDEFIFLAGNNYRKFLIQVQAFHPCLQSEKLQKKNFFVCTEKQDSLLFSVLSYQQKANSFP